MKVQLDVKTKLENSLDLQADSLMKMKKKMRTKKKKKKQFAKLVASQITDAVKCYLRDIGKIPLLNKKTETVIAEQIASE